MTTATRPEMPEAGAPAPVPAAVVPLGHSGRVRRGTREVSLLLLVLLLVFGLMAAHDEIIAELGDLGWLPRGRAEFYELVLCGILFVIWSLAMLRLMALLRKTREEAARAPDPAKESRR